MRKLLLGALLLLSTLGFSQIAGNGVSDIDNNNYQTVIIGQQEWMAENLKTTKYSNGDNIPTTPFFNYNYFDENEPKYQWSVPGFPSYGRHYTWFVVTDNRNICPNGWSVPSANDWETLIEFLGGYDSGGRLKEIGNANWDLPNSDATNDTGFNALPSGWHHFYGGNDAIGYNSFFTSKTEYSLDDGFYIYLNAGNSNINFNAASPTKKMGLSCRCIKNNTLGLQDNNLIDIKIFPNPTTDIINIDYVDNIEYVLYNTIGQVVTSGKSKAIDISMFNDGIYVLHLTIDNRTVIKKIVKN